MAKHPHPTIESTNPSGAEPLPRDLKKWVPLSLFLVCAGGGSWYWSTRPANVQALISEVRDGSNLPHVMTVEAISESGASIVGRSVSIKNARVTAVTGQRTFWLEADEAEPLLVVHAPSPSVVTPVAGSRVSVDELILRDGD
jgi:hypothetical protein